MKCPWCGTAREPTNGFCTECGKEWIEDFTRSTVEDQKPESVAEIEHKMKCFRCANEMTFIGEEKLQRSSTISNLFFGEFGDLLKGTLDLNVYLCTDCFKVEFELSDKNRAFIERLKREGEMHHLD